MMILPQGWTIVALHEICGQPASGFSAVGEDANARPNTQDKGVLKLSCIQDGCFRPSENKLVNPDQSGKLKTPVKGDSIIISRSNTPDLVGAVCHVEHNHPHLYLSDLMWQVTTKKTDVSTKWLAYLLCSEQIRRTIKARANGTSGSMKKITKGSFLAIKVPVPTPNEQTAIASILSLWDRAIEKTEALIAAKEKRKKALMQQLLTGKRRFPEFEGQEWKEYKLGRLFNQRRDSGNGGLPLVSITRNKGVISRDDVNRKDTSNADKSRYLRICPGDIGYNTMRMWQGVSGVSRLDGIVSPAYTVCIPRPQVDAEFMGYLFKYEPIINLFWRYSQGLVSDTLNLKFNNFAKIKMRVPAKNEQMKIASVFRLLDKEIEGLKKEVAAIQAQKRGLMQQLLTGKTRVKFDA